MVEPAVGRVIVTGIRRATPHALRRAQPAQSCRLRHISTANTVPSKTADPRTSEYRAHTLPATPETSRGRSRLDELRSDPHPQPFSSFLTDNYARQHNYLRISVAERCNLRCLYCMPEEGIALSPSAQLLTAPEIVYLAELFVNQGVDKIRLTGGEPTVRKDIVDLMHQIGQLKQRGLKELCITTNGISLHRKLDAMVESGLTGINLSLDTLDPYQFAIMTRRNGHEAVMKSIDRVLDMNKRGAGLKLKINCVVMRGFNEREIIPFVELGRDQDIEVRFIEYMPFEGNKWSEKKMMAFGEMLALIRQKYPDVQKVQDHHNDTSKTYHIPGFAGRIGFITSMTHNFCGTCNRLRITADGNLKVCLFGNAEVSLRDILRESNDGSPIDTAAMDAIRQLECDHHQRRPVDSPPSGPTDREARLLDVIGRAVKRKKEKHAGIGELENMKNRPMILIDDLLPSPAPSTVPRPWPSVASGRVATAQLAFAPAWSSSVLLSDLFAPPFQTPRPIGRRAYSQSRASTLGRWRFSFHRYVQGESVFRRVPSPDPPNLPAHIPASPGDAQKRTRIGLQQDAGPAQPHLGDNLKASSPATDDVDDPLESIADPRPFDDEGSTESDVTAPDSGVAAASDEASWFSSAPHGSANLSHLSSSGEAHMVSIAEKQPTARSALATTVLLFSHDRTYEGLSAVHNRKGDVLAVARIAGIQAAKKTSDLIPLAHPGLGITGAWVRLVPFDGTDLPYHLTREKLGLDPGRPLYGGVVVSARVACEGKTGVEMEALTAASVAGLTMYDMLKAVDKAMVLTETRVLAKSGGKSGDWRYDWTERKVMHSSKRPLRMASGLRPPNTLPRVTGSDFAIAREKRLARLLAARREKSTSEHD